MPLVKRSGSPERLAVFARFPDPGRAKTRLIPALGPEGAARIHKEMVRHTLKTADDLAARRAVIVEVWTSGGELDPYCAMFGARAYRTQGEGGLGDRMARAFRSMLAVGPTAIIIGTDCPELDPNTLIEAFDSLRSHDLVLGPANDGGYYLIGLRVLAPSLFEGIEWGTETVFSETLRRAADHGLSVHRLRPLDDVDEPRNIDIWERVRPTETDHNATYRPVLSVVIPTWNEADSIAAAIRSARCADVEIIVADGGGDDATAAIAASEGARVVPARRGRGPQLNAGAAVARGEYLLFLHADTRPAVGYLSDVLEVMATKDVVLGAFRLGIDRPGLFMRGIEAAVRIRCALFALPYGDQALFLRAETFASLGGFADVPIMEDLDLVRRVRKLGRVRIVRRAVTTSGRRWGRSGVFMMTFINQICVLGFDLGISPRRLAEWRDGLTGVDGSSRPLNSPETASISGQAEVFPRVPQ